MRLWIILGVLWLLGGMALLISSYIYIIDNMRRR
jgi:hypothetical protein